MDKKANALVTKFWNPPDHEKYQWKHPRPQWVRHYASTTRLTKVDGPAGEEKKEELPEFLQESYRSGEALRIYESHVGMSTEKKGIATYRDFAE